MIKKFFDFKEELKIWQGIKLALKLLKNLFLACGKFLQGVTGKKTVDSSPVVSGSKKIASSDFNAENFPKAPDGKNSLKIDKEKIATEATEATEKTGTIRLIENRVAELKRNAKKIADVFTKEGKPLDEKIIAIYDPEIIRDRVLHGATLKRFPAKEIETFLTPETDKQGIYAEKQLIHDKAGFAPHAYEREDFGSIALIWGNGRQVGLNHIMGERIKTGIAYGLLLRRIFGTLVFGEYEQINPDRFLFADKDFYAVVEKHPTTPGIFILVDFFEYGPHLIRKSRGRKNKNKKIIVTFPDGDGKGLPTNYPPTHKHPTPANS